MSTIIETTASSESNTKDWYIRQVSEAGDRYGNKLIHMMDIYNAGSLQEMKLEDVKEYYEKHILGR